jgi:hypothetical protein
MISRRKSSFRFSGISIFSSMERINRSSGSTSSPVKRSFTFSFRVKALIESM